MRQKPRDNFHFIDISREQFCHLLNDKYPVKLRYNEDLINRIHTRYPLVDKAQIAIVVRGTFESFRDFLFMGKIINLYTLFFDFKAFVYKKSEKFSLKSSIKTPSEIK